ncbi:MAG: lamin tail domain-containing protein, partial [Bacteroidales bacterium]|nr:lamin tail domain-containing protein [Bacteroidales bacterium]
MKKPVLFISALLVSLGLWGQNLSDLIISEAMPGNPASVTDDYGNHPDWIEIFNTSQGTVNFGGCFLTDD